VSFKAGSHVLHHVRPRPGEADVTFSRLAGPFQHAHMLRHACGYALANKGIDTRTLQAYLAIAPTTQPQLNHALCGVGPGSVQKHLGQA
jgi:integrase